MAVNTVEILASINKSVAFIAKNMSAQNTSAEGKPKTSSSLLGGLSLPKTDNKDDKTVLGTANVKTAISVLTQLPNVVVAIAKLSGGTMKKFNIVMSDFSKSYIEFDKSLNVLKKDSPKKILEFSEATKGLSVAIKGAAGLVATAPIAALGIKMSAWVIKGMVGIIDYVASKKITITKLNKFNGLIILTRRLVNVVKQGVMLIGLCIGLGAIVAVAGPKVILGGLAVLGGTLIMLVGIIGVVGFASKLMKSFGVLKGMKQIIYLTVASMMLVAGCIALGAYVSNGDTKKILLNGLLILGGTLVAMLAIAVIAGVAGRVARSGIKGLASTILLAFGAMGLVVGAVFLGNYINTGKNKSNIKTGLMWTGIVIGGMMTIAILAGNLSNAVMKGIAAMAAIELLALGAMGIVSQAIKLGAKLKEKGSFGSAMAALGTTTLILTAFGGLALAATAAFVWIAPGLVALAAIEGVALGAIKVVDGVVRIKDDIEKAGGSKVLSKVVTEDVGAIFRAFNKDTLNIKFSFKDYIQIQRGLNIVKKAVSTALLSVDALSKIAEVADLIQGSGESTQIRKVISRDSKTGEPKYSDWVNLDHVVKGITGAIAAFVKNLDFGIEKPVKKMRDAKKVTKLLGKMIGPVSSFVDMVTKLESNEEGRLGRIEYDENGNLKPVKYIDVAGVATSVVGVISKFVETLYSPQNAQRWSAIMFNTNGRTNRNTRAVKKMGTILDNVLEPITSFIDVVMGFSTEDGKLKNSEGKPVDLDDVAIKITGAITHFLDSLFTKNFKDYEDNSKIMVDLLKPITGISDLLGKMTNNNGNGSFGQAAKEVDMFRLSLDHFATYAVTKHIVETNDGLAKLSGYLQVTNDKVITVATSIKELDKVLDKEKQNRIKAIDDMANAFGRMSNNAAGANSALTALKLALDAINSADVSKIDGVVESVSKYKPKAMPSTGSQYEKNKEEDKTPRITIDDIQDAITNALKSLSMKRAETSTAGIQNVDVAAIVEALNKNIIFE